MAHLWSTLWDKAVQHPVWSKVIATVIGGLALAALLRALAWVWRAFRRRKAPVTPEPVQESPAVDASIPDPPALEPTKPRRVEFKGIVWRERGGELLPCCPKCDVELTCRHAHAGIDSRFTLGPVRYRCGECGWETMFEGRHSHLVDGLRRKLARDERAKNVN
jgi:hypothetical protein